MFRYPKKEKATLYIYQGGRGNEFLRRFRFVILGGQEMEGMDLEKDDFIYVLYVPEQLKTACVRSSELFKEKKRKVQKFGIVCLVSR